jgi:Outer membrane lipoprotein-sorting protein
MNIIVHRKYIWKQMPLLLWFLLPFFLFGQTAKEIVQKADAKMRGNTSIVEITIKTVRPSWSRSMDVKAWTKGTDYSLILVQSPAKDKGIVFLKRKKEVWNWMPSLERIIKLPPSMMSQSWMGTDFTNDDLVKESSVLKDYDHSLVGDTVIGDRACYIIQMIPKAEAAVVWGKLIVCIDKMDFIELHTRFYDEDGVLINSMNGYDIKMMDGRLIPTRFEMIPADKRNHKTEMIYRSVQYDRPINDGFFTTEKMKALR